MSVNQKKGPNELKKTNHFINEQIAKIQKDTQELINRTIDGQPSKVSVVKVSENKIIIEVDLNEFNLDNNKVEHLVDYSDDSTKKNKPLKDNQNVNSTDSKNSTNKSLGKLNKDDSVNQKNSNRYEQSSVENSDLDGCNENRPPLRGILKYSNSWKKRTLSESSFDNSSSFTSDHEDDDNNLSLSCSDLDFCTLDKSSKKVTFNKKILSKVFSKNQRTIETKSKKGKKNKKNNNKKAKSIDDKDQTQKLSNRAVQTESLNNGLIKDKLNISNVSIDELSFLVCSSEESDNQISAVEDILQKADDSDNAKNDLESDVQDDDEKFFEQKIDHQPLDKENWSEMKSKKVKKNRKRNDSGTESSQNLDLAKENTETAADKSVDLILTNSTSSLEESCDQENVRGKMSLDIKNLIKVN